MLVFLRPSFQTLPKLYTVELGEGREQTSNKGSENKYKEIRGTIEEIDMRNSEKNFTSREHVHVFRVIFYSIFHGGDRCLGSSMVYCKSFFIL